MDLYEKFAKNEEFIKSTFDGRGDFISREIKTEGGRAFVFYVDGLANRDVIDFAVVSKLMKNGANDVTTADLSKETDLDKIITSVLSGDAAVFVDEIIGTSAYVVSAKGFANRGVAKAENESVVVGPQEAFTEPLRINTALIRRRLRDRKLMVKQIKIGRRSKTDVALVYLEDVVRPSVLAETLKRLESVKTADAFFDGGQVAQALEDEHRAFFPQIQLTERPDKAASAVSEGRIAVIVDNSPSCLLVPATLATFFQSSEDYYEKHQIMSAIRGLRYIAAILAVILPGLYLCAVTFNPSVIPTGLALKIAAARQNVPLPAVFEILVMEAAFELLREAGIRLPGAVGGAMGIVGGLIVGQCAVEAGIVSAGVVIVVAATGIAGFCVPNYSLAAGVRAAKYFVLIMSAVLGFFGFWAALLVTCAKLAKMRSFGFPYLFPFASGEVNGFGDFKDSFFRVPQARMKRRPIFANPENSARRED